ncbi:MAG: hypothetical protein ACLPVF_14685, partial [Acidimicrobiales bacterium]
FVDWKPAAIPGALIYGYSTSIITNLMFGHVSVALMVIPPLLFAALHDALVTQKHSPWHDGLVLCALAVVQFAIAPETLVMCGLLAAIAIVAAAAVGWRHVAGRARHAALALVIGAVPTLVLLAYPLWLGLSGPQSINGALYPAAPTSGAALNQFFSAGAYHALPGPLERFAGYMGHAGPPPNFLGWGVGVVALASLVAAWRRPLAWLLVLLAAACAWLSFGTMWLGAPTALTHLWLPWRILQHVRAVNQISPAQLSPFLVLFLACLIGLGLDAAHGAWVRSTPSSRTLTRVAGAGGIALVSLVVLAPVWLTYDVPLVVTPLAIPAWMSQAAPRLGEHTVVLTVPFAIEGDMVPMLWQAEDAMHFRLAGAALYTPEAHGLQVPLRTQGAARQVLTNLSEVGKVEPSSRRDIDAVRAALGKWHTNLVVITGPSQDPVYASGFFAAVLGAPPTMVDGAWVWQVPTQLPAPRPIANGTLARCRAAAAGTSARLRPLTMAHCVLAGPSAT